MLNNDSAKKIIEKHPPLTRTTICYKDVQAYIASIADKLKGRKIILHPYGKGGRLARHFLNKMGIEPDYIVDRRGYMPESAELDKNHIYSPEILESLDLDKFAIIMVTDWTKELYYPLLEKYGERFPGLLVFSSSPPHSIHTMNITTTEECNLKCPMCPNHTTVNPKTMDTDKIKDILFQARELGVEMVIFIGNGEPLLHPDILDILAYTASLDFPAVRFYTNAVLLNDKNIDGILSSGVDQLVVSHSGHSLEVFSKMQGYDVNAAKVKEITVNNIQKFKRRRDDLKAKTELIITTLLFEGLEDDFTQFVDYWKDRVDDIWMSYIRYGVVPYNAVHDYACSHLGRHLNFVVNGDIRLCNRECIYSEILGNMSDDLLKHLVHDRSYLQKVYYNEIGQIDKLDEVCQTCEFTVANPAGQSLVSYRYAQRFLPVIQKLNLKEELFVFGISHCLMDFVMCCCANGYTLKLRVFNCKDVGIFHFVPCELPSRKALYGKEVIVFSDNFAEASAQLTECGAIAMHYSDFCE